jgi:cell division protein FtsW
LLLVFFIGSSPAGSDSKRWILIAGFSLQPSELMKVAVIAYLAAFFHNHYGRWQLWRPMVIIGFAAAAIVAEPDVGTAAFIFVLAISIMIAAGTTLMRLFSITFISLVFALLIGGPYLSQFTYIADRFTGFWDMVSGSQELTQTESYQMSQAQRSLERAGILGISTGRRPSVPEADTDMIAISIGHSLGLFGSLALVSLFAVIAIRGMQISSSLAGPGALLAAGATCYICGQAALNLLVASNIVPTTGIPLPFVSYGLNSLVSVAIAMGFLHSSHREAQAQEALVS